MEKPRLRDSKKLKAHEPYPLNEIPEKLITDIGAYFVYLIYVGRKDLSGSDWGDAFAKAVGGVHLDSPAGIADVVLNENIAWSMKTVKNKNPLTCKTVRLISGRCSPDYSYGITDPHKDIQKTGQAVLEIWNERVNIARDNYSNVRTSVLIRSEDLLSYAVYESENERYRTSDYVWEVNSNGNLIGKDKLTEETHFTWQPHGSQFTIHEKVPSGALKFTIKQPPVVTQKSILEAIKFDESWVKIVK